MPDLKIQVLVHDVCEQYFVLATPSKKHQKVFTESRECHIDLCTDARVSSHKLH